MEREEKNKQKYGTKWTRWTTDRMLARFSNLMKILLCLCIYRKWLNGSTFGTFIWCYNSYYDSHILHIIFIAAFTIIIHLDCHIDLSECLQNSRGSKNHDINISKNCSWKKIQKFTIWKSEMMFVFSDQQDSFSLFLSFIHRVIVCAKCVT